MQSYTSLTYLTPYFHFHPKKSFRRQRSMSKLPNPKKTKNLTSGYRRINIIIFQTYSFSSHTGVCASLLLRSNLTRLLFRSCVSLRVSSNEFSSNPGGMQKTRKGLVQVNNRARRSFARPYPGVRSSIVESSFAREKRSRTSSIERSRFLPMFA